MVPLVQQPRDPGWWQERMQRLVATWLPGRHHLPGERLRCAGILAELVHAFGFGEAAVIDQRSLSDRVAEVLAEADIRDRELRIADLAAAAGLGQTAFRAEVKALTGQSPRSWLEQRRCDLAMVMLQSGARRVATVAAACGYDDPYHFSRVMRRKFGAPPSAFMT